MPPIQQSIVDEAVVIRFNKVTLGETIERSIVFIIS